jgi:initiation factor 1A
MFGLTHQKRHDKNNKRDIKPSQFRFTKDDEKYALVTKVGAPHCTIQLINTNEEKQASIKGSLKKGKNNRIFNGDIVIAQPNIGKDQPYIIIHKYQSDEVRELKKHGEIKELPKSTEPFSITYDNHDDVFNDDDFDNI